GRPPAPGGFMLHLYLTGRRRAFELAVLEVFGARRRDLWGPVAVEQGALVGYGVLCGGIIGLLVALISLPAILQFADRPTQPPPIYTPDWVTLGLALGLAVLLVGLGLAAVVAALVRQARPALLREEELWASGGVRGTPGGCPGEHHRRAGAGGRRRAPGAGRAAAADLRGAVPPVHAGGAGGGRPPGGRLRGRLGRDGGPARAVGIGQVDHAGHPGWPGTAVGGAGRARRDRRRPALGGPADHAAPAPAGVRLAGPWPEPPDARLGLGEPGPADGPGRAAGRPGPPPGRGAAGRRRPGRSARQAGPR